MNIIEKNICSDEELLMRESELRTSTLTKQNGLACIDSMRHLNEGFVRRHYMLQSSRLFLMDLCSKGNKPLSPYEATDCAIHLNAYYINLRGALDNLAWVLQYEWQLLTGITEDSPSRLKCNLFTKDFITAQHVRHPDLASLLSRYGNWAKELAELRDPAAHRVPIYVPPSTLTSHEQLENFKNILAQIDVPSRELGDKYISEIYREAQAVGDFIPIMIISTPQGLMIRSISAQVRYDHDKYLSIASAVVNSLGPQ